MRNLIQLDIVFKNGMIKNFPLVANFYPLSGGNDTLPLSYIPCPPSRNYQHKVCKKNLGAGDSINRDSEAKISPQLSIDYFPTPRGKSPSLFGRLWVWRDLNPRHRGS